MCGIIGYVGYREAEPVLLEGLRRLEYRGYDSAGVATLTGPRLHARKKAGRVADLAAVLGRQPAPGRAGPEGDLPRRRPGVRADGGGLVDPGPPAAGGDADAARPGRRRRRPGPRPLRPLHAQGDLRAARGAGERPARPAGRRRGDGP